MRLDERPNRFPASGPGARPRRPAARAAASFLAFAAAALFAMPAAVRAGEPLYLRIRPQPSPEGAAPAGRGEGRIAADGRRESVWERADRRARLAIASVCTGCLDARFLERPAAAAAPSEPAAPAVRASRVPPATEVAAAEPDPSTTGDP